MAHPNSASAAPVDERALRRIGLLSMVGSSAEFFDFYLYGTASALVFPKLFFPSSDPALGVLISFSTFAIGFLARPVGGAIWGHFGDRIGRKKAFLAALIIMAVGSTLIGLLPTYATLGIAAPLLLTALRLVQGLAVGGQWGGAVLLATEFAPSNKRGFYGSLPQIGVPMGILGGVVAYFFLGKAMSDEAFESYGWRIPFLASIVVLLIAYYAHRKLEETPAFAHLRQLSESEQARAEQVEPKPTGAGSPLLAVLRGSWRTILAAAGAFMILNVSNYLYITFMVDYGTRTLHLDKATVLLALAVAAVFMTVALPLAGTVSDRVGRRPMLLAGTFGNLIWAFPVFWLVDTRDAVLITAALTIGEVINCVMYGALAAYFAELFRVQVRYSGMSLTYQLGGLLGGVLSAPVAAALMTRYNDITAVAIQVATLAAISSACALLLPETYRHDLDDAESVEAAAP